MENENKLKIKNVETYTDDIVRVLADDKEGTIKKIIQEEEEKEKQKKNVSPESIKNKTSLLVGITLVIIAFASLVFAWVYSNKIVTVPVAPQFTSIIFTDKNSFNDISVFPEKDTAFAIFGLTHASDVKQKGVEGIYFTENNKVIGFSKLVSLIKGNFPQEGLSKISESFLFGVVNEETKDPFFLFKANSFQGIFPYMKIWEKKMFSDLHGFFGIDINTKTNYLLTKDFADGVVANKNARILYDNADNIALMYIFADDTSVIITNSVPATEEIINRLSSSKVKK